MLLIIVVLRSHYKSTFVGVLSLLKQFRACSTTHVVRGPIVVAVLQSFKEHGVAHTYTIMPTFP